MIWVANIRTFLFYLVCIPFTVVWSGFFALIAYLIPYPARFHVIVGGWSSVVHFLVWLLLGIKVRIHGRENIPDKPAVVIANHQSAWETFFLQRVFTPQSPVAKASIMKIPFFGWVFSMLHPIAIDRSNVRKAMRQVIDKGSDRIAQGSFVLIFPEGTRTSPDKPLPFRKSGAMLAKKAGCDMIPVTHNAGEFWLNDRFAKLPGPIDLYIHSAINTSEDSASDLMKHAETVVLGKLAEISNASVNTEAVSNIDASQPSNSSDSNVAVELDAAQ